MPMSGDYWPWWLGAVALAGIAVLHGRGLGRLLGVSGVMAHILNWREEKAARRAELEFGNDDEAFHKALLAATIEEFGEDLALADTEPETDDRGESGLSRRDPPSMYLVFLIGVTAGGFLAALSRGAFSVQLNLGMEFGELIATGGLSWLALLIGGILVGFGTSMAGGCTAGHGLSGCARLQPGSILATASFFGAGVILSLLLEHIW